MFDEILTRLGLGAVPALPVPDPALTLDPSRYVGFYERPGTRYEVAAEGGALHLLLDLDPEQAAVLGRPERLRYDLVPVSGTHFLLPPVHPLEDTQTAAIYDFADGAARYLHINARVHPRSQARR